MLYSGLITPTEGRFRWEFLFFNMSFSLLAIELKDAQDYRYSHEPMSEPEATSCLRAIVLFAGER